MTGHVHVVLGATVTAVALAACTWTGSATSGSGAAPESPASQAGLVLDVPVDFARADDRDDGASWRGPPRDDGTRVGITAARLCHEPRPTWEQVVDVVAQGEHTGWSDFTPTSGPVEMRVDGATAALRVRGTYTLPVASTGERVELVHDELLLQDPAGTVHRLHVEGAAGAVDDLDLDALFASVAVAEPGCPS